MKIILLNPRLRTWSPNVYVPLGLTYIAAVLEREGHNVEVIDLNVQKIDINSLQKIVTNAEIVGITGMITEYQEVIRLANIVKEAKTEVKLVLGGPLASTLPEELLKNSRSDFVVIGEGEKTIVNLVSAIRQDSGFSDVKGIAYKTDSKVNFTGSVVPIQDIRQYHLRVRIQYPYRHLQ